MLLSNETRADYDRFLMVFKTGETELFEFNSTEDCLFYIESGKEREHDGPLTGCDFNKFVNLLVTSDASGMIRIWNINKKFLREILFPHPVDSVCFLNTKGDLLVSHEERISVIKFETYWTKSFDHFGITTSGARDANMRPSSADSECNAFVVPPHSVRRLLIMDDNDMAEVLNSDNKSKKTTPD